MGFPRLAVAGIVVVAETAEPVGIVAVVEPAGIAAVVEPAGIAAEAVLEACCYYYCP